MNLKQLHRLVKEQLKLASIENQNEARVIVEVATGQEFTNLTSDNIVSDEIVNLTLALVDKRKSGYPLQYIATTWSFMDFELSVGPGVLIPRPETETTAKVAIDCLKNVVNPNVIDLCSGTGAIAIAIRRAYIVQTITALEKYDEAFSYLRKNSQNYDINIVKADVFGYESLLVDNSLDLIVSNPPYVSKQEYVTLERELYFEPKYALSDEADGLTFYRYISNAYRSKLKQQAYLVFEVASQRANDVKCILKSLSYGKIEIISDEYGMDRVVVAQKMD